MLPANGQVQPLRHHVEDVAELVPHLIARLTRGSELTCSADAMRALMRNRWPGNVEQLYQVLRKTVARRRAGVLTPTDLPPETRAITRRVLTPLEAIECDAIVEALLDNHGNKAEAARHLGMSRATITEDPRLRHLGPGRAHLTHGWPLRGRGPPNRRGSGAARLCLRDHSVKPAGGVVAVEPHLALSARSTAVRAVEQLGPLCP